MVPVDEQGASSKIASGDLLGDHFVASQTMVLTFNPILLKFCSNRPILFGLISRHVIFLSNTANCADLPPGAEHISIISIRLWSNNSFAGIDAEIS